MVEGSPYIWLMCTVINVQGNNYYMVEGALTCGSSARLLMWGNNYYMVEGTLMCGSCARLLTCSVITTIWCMGTLTCGINMHGNYYYMVEGGPHMWLTCGN